MDAPQVFDTDRLRLQAPRLEDAEEIYAAYATDPEATRYLLWHPHANVEETRSFLRGRVSALARGATDFYWTVRLRDEGTLIGAVALGIDGFKANLGYVLARAHWRRGYATEAVGAVTDWARQQPEIWRVWAECDVDNPASARVLEKIGLRREGVLRRWLMHPNVSDQPRDCFCFAWVREARNDVSGLSAPETRRGGTP